MFSYETGIFIAFLLWLIGAINTVVTINSQLEANLNKVGMRLSRLSLASKEMDSDDKKRPTYLKVLFWLTYFVLGLLTILLSWFSVLWFVGSFTYGRIKDSGAPTVVREYRWKMRNVNMTMDQIIHEMVKLSVDNSVEFNQLKRDITCGMEERGLL